MNNGIHTGRELGDKLVIEDASDDQLDMIESFKIRGEAGREIVKRHNPSNQTVTLELPANVGADKASAASDQDVHLEPFHIWAVDSAPGVENVAGTLDNHLKVENVMISH